MKPNAASRICAVLWLCLMAPEAAIHRISMFIGVNQGLESEAELKFASRDARAMAEIFRQTGLYRSEAIILLSDVSLAKVRESMAAIEETAARLKKQGSQIQLFVYFSGHGDAKSLHIRGQSLNREDLVAWLNRLPCELKIVVLDACESGDFLRSKGGRFLQDLPVQIENNLKSRGSIIVSSTSRGELAQESDEYQGAVFTHHFANGLRGLADYNADGWVGLQESFEYSRRATSLDMAMQGSLRQNPSFDLDLVGGSDPGIIPIDRGKSWMQLRNFPSGNLDIYDANSLDRVSRVWLSGSDSLAYRIPTGAYLFRFHEGGREFLLTEAVGRTGGVSIDRNAFREKVKGSWTSKGGPAVRLNGMQTAFGAPHPFAGVGMRMGTVGIVTRTAGVKRILSFGYGKGSRADAGLGLANDLEIYRLAYSRMCFLAGNRRLRLSSGGMAAFGRVRQTLTDSRFGGDPIMESGVGSRPAITVQWANLYQVGLPFDLEWALFGRLWLSGEALYSVYGFKDGARDRFRFRLELEPSLSLGFHF